MGHPRWKMQWHYNETVQLIDILVKNTESAERESHYHEVWSELLNFLCKSYKKELSRLSCIPQYEVGYQPSGSGDEEEDADEVGQRSGGPRTRSKAKDEQDTVDMEDMIGDASMCTSAQSAATTAISSISRRDDKRGSEAPDTKWQRPDWLIIGRIFIKAGRLPGKLASEIRKEYPILIFELKRDPHNNRVGDHKAGDELDAKHVDKLVASAIPQVLQQAQFVFAEFEDAADTIHAIVAVGTICQDFSISKSELPPLSEKLLNDPAKPPSARQQLALARRYAKNKSEAYPILNKGKTGLHPKFLNAWRNARKVCTTFKRY